MDDFEKKMENLEPPKAESQTYQKHFKMYLVNTQRSAWAGFLLLIVPVLVLAGMLMRFNFGLGGGWVADFAVWLANLDSPLLPLIMLGAPLLAVILNALAVVHIRHNKAAGELALTIRLKWINLLVIGLCSLILAYLFLFLLVENINHP